MVGVACSHSDAAHTPSSPLLRISHLFSGEEFYVNAAEFDDDAWTFIFYTGKKRKLVIDPSMLQPSVKFFPGRADLEHIITDIVDWTEDGALLPPDFIDKVRGGRVKGRLN